MTTEIQRFKLTAKMQKYKLTAKMQRYKLTAKIQNSYKERESCQINHKYTKYPETHNDKTTTGVLGRDGGFSNVR